MYVYRTWPEQISSILKRICASNHNIEYFNKWDKQAYMKKSVRETPNSEIILMLAPVMRNILKQV